MEAPLAFWGIFFAIVIVLMALDLGILHRKDRSIGFKEALKMSAFYFAIAMLFAGGVYKYYSEQAAYEFVIGYLIELSLSVDNIFVFILIFTHFAVPRNYQHRVLFWGIIGAIVMRGILIAGGSILIHKFSWVIYIFGAFLILTGVKMLMASNAEPDLQNNKIVNFMRRNFRITDGFEGKRFFKRIDGKLWFTPLFMVLVLVEFTDVIFALDSIPAIFAVTTDTFVVITSNVFAIMGLRSLYFALAAIIHRFEYLKYGLSLILVFIGSKMLINHYFAEKIISTETSLLVTVVVLAISIVVSLAKTKHDKPAEVTGWVPGSPVREDAEKE